jgi:hypothetical protein
VLVVFFIAPLIVIARMAKMIGLRPTTLLLLASLCEMAFEALMRKAVLVQQRSTRWLEFVLSLLVPVASASEVAT